MLDAAEVLREIGSVETALASLKAQLHSISIERDDTAALLEAEKRDLAELKQQAAELAQQTAKASERLDRINAEIDAVRSRLGLSAE